MMTSPFAKSIFDQSEIVSVARPTNELTLSERALFMTKFIRILSFAIAAMLPAVATAENSLTKEKSQTKETVIDSIGIVWGMAQLPSGEFLLTDRSGSLTLFDAKGQNPQVINNVPKVRSSGQGGLLDVVLHPDYAENGWLYLSYSSVEKGSNGSNTAIMRAQLKKSELVNKQVIYKASPTTKSRHHYGSRIAFDREGFLYFSIGDRGARDVNPQDLSKDGGKIYRIHDDGQIPKDNPFVDQKGAKPAIYAYGNRNPQGMAMNPATGIIWAHEHGPKGGDEINIIAKGKNYGWPVISYGINYSGTKFTDLTEKDGMEQPVWYWDPSIAPSGMAFVTSDKYPDWKGHLLVGSLKFNYLVLCKLEGNKVVSQEIVYKGIGRVRDVREMPDGYIYVATEGNKLERLIHQ